MDTWARSGSDPVVKPDSSLFRIRIRNPGLKKVKGSSRGWKLTGGAARYKSDLDTVHLYNVVWVEANHGRF